MPDETGRPEIDLLGRLERASSAAEQLITEAARASAASLRGEGRERPPPAGWQPTGPHSATETSSDTDVLTQVIGSLRELVPPDLQRRLGEAIRELLLAIRALVDWCLERVESKRSAGTEVEDIPIL